MKTNQLKNIFICITKNVTVQIIVCKQRKLNMTLQQLKYTITLAETGTITEAASKLYISQPSLTNAIHELEKDMNIIIFNRTNKGISISKEGEDFLGYARQMLEQATILEDKYKGDNGGKKKFCVSTQHYSFAVNAFVDLIKKLVRMNMISA